MLLSLLLRHLPKKKRGRNHHQWVMTTQGRACAHLSSASFPVNVTIFQTGSWQGSTPPPNLSASPSFALAWWYYRAALSLEKGWRVMSADNGGMSQRDVSGSVPLALSKPLCRATTQGSPNWSLVKADMITLCICDSRSRIFQLLFCESRNSFRNRTAM